MAQPRSKVWVSGEVLTAADLNGEFNNIVLNGEDVPFPATKAKDFDGQELVLDADGDSSITVDTDDRLDFKLGGVDLFRMNGTTASSVNGIDFVGSATGTPAIIRANGTDANVGLNVEDDNSNEMLILAAVASAVNEVTITNAATSNDPSVAATGGDTNIDLNLVSKGSGVVQANGAAVLTAATVFPSGTEMLFYQDTAPTGWTITAGVDETTVRLTKGSGAGGQAGGVTGGTHNFSTQFASLAESATPGVGDRVLVTAELPSHDHVQRVFSGSGSAGAVGSQGVTSANTSDSAGATANTGSGNAHGHTVDLRVKWAACIIASKD